MKNLVVEAPSILAPETRELIRNVLVESTTSRAPAHERRVDVRVPFPQLLSVTPIDCQTQQPQGDTIVVVGRHLSERGIDFFHPKPLACRWVVVDFHASPDRPIRLLTDLDWCRFTEQGWYVSGGRFLRLAG